MSFPGRYVRPGDLQHACMGCYSTRFTHFFPCFVQDGLPQLPRNADLLYKSSYVTQR